MNFKKAYHVKVEQSLLDERFEYAKNKGYPKQKWIEFCEKILSTHGLSVTLYEAKKTFSKRSD